MAALKHTFSTVADAMLIKTLDVPTTSTKDAAEL
jgi:hypothetical protein